MRVASAVEPTSLPQIVNKLDTNGREIVNEIQWVFDLMRARAP
jgi:hypothetical protein